MYNDFKRDYYLKMMGLHADQIPNTLLLHGVMDVGRHLPRWRQCFAETSDTPFTNMFLGTRGGRSCAFAAVYGGPAAVSIRSCPWGSLSCWTPFSTKMGPCAITSPAHCRPLRQRR